MVARKMAFAPAGQGLLNVAVAAVVAFAVLAQCGTAAAQTTRKAPPSRLLHVPKMTTPPKIDGAIGEHEWDEAAAFTAVGNPMGAVVPQFQQVAWYLGYDNDNLYIYMHAPKPKDMILVAKTKTHDAGNAIIFEDHTEIQISNHGREGVTKVGSGFYKICTNPLDTVSDEWYFCPTSGSEFQWESGAVVKSGVQDDRWDQEIAIPLKSILPAGAAADGAQFVIQLVRADTCGGVYFVGWAAADWQAWPKFADVTLDPKAPAVQFTRLGDLTDCNIDAEVKYTGKAGSAVTVQALVTNKAGQPIYDETKPLKPGETATFKKDGIALEDTGNNFVLSVTQDGGAMVLCQTNIVNKMTPDYRQKYLEPWLSTKPRAGDYRFGVVYWPYYGKLKASVDLDFFGVRPELSAATGFEVTVLGPDGKEVLKQAGAIKDKKGEALLAVPKLAPGEYKLKLKVLSADGKVVDDKKEASITRQAWPWEGNKLGTEDVVVPPYEPITAKDLTLNVWGRQITVGPGGLPAKIVNQQEDILAAPMFLEATVAGKAAPWQGGAAKVADAKPHRAAVAGEAQVAGIPVKVDAFMEYDGWYQVSIRLEPSAPVEVESLDSVIPLWDGADTVDFKRGWYLGDSSRFAGAVPAGDGVVWDSGKLAPYGEWGSFVPEMFIGNGDKGLWVFAPNREDWVLDGKRATVSLERAGGKPQLRIRFIAGKTTIEKPRLLDLVFLPEPVKPLPKDWRATAWAYPTAHYIHDTNGYRYYGAQVDGFTLPTDEDFVALRDLIDGTYKFPAEAKDRPGPGVRQRSEKLPIALYASATRTGMCEEFHTFCGEWLGDSLYVPQPEGQFDGQWNATKRIQWKSAYQNSVPWVNWTQSLIDCYVWYYEKYIRISRVSGTWWDDGGLTTLTDWDARRGRLVNQWWMLHRRQLTKRLNTINAQNNVPPVWIINQHTDFSWTQIAWHIEEIFYGMTKGKAYFGVLTPDQFRAVTRSRGGVIPRLAPRAEQELSKEEQAHFYRTAYGMAALHDIGAYMASQQDYESVQSGRIPLEQNQIRMMLENTVGALSGEGECIPYWRVGKLVHVKKDEAGKPRKSDLLVTVYRGRGKALLVIANRTDKPAEFVHWLWEIDDSLLGHPVRQMVDAATWEQLAPMNVKVPAWDFRFVLVE